MRRVLIAVLLIVGVPVISFADDLVAPPPRGRELASTIPSARYLEIPDAGHYGYLEQPGAVNAAVLDFFADLTAA